MDKHKIAITLGIVCLILTIAICVQIKTVKSTNSTVAQTLTENSLRDEVLKWKEKSLTFLCFFSLNLLLRDISD